MITEQASSLNEGRKGMNKLLALIKVQEPTEELVQDSLTTVSVFAGRLDAHRAKQVREQVKAALATCEQEEPTEPR